MHTHANSRRFLDLCQRLSIPCQAGKAAWHALLDRYSEPHRFYHDLNHIESMLRDWVGIGTANPSMELAIWFHDVIYDPRAVDNEARSAGYFEVSLGSNIDEALSNEVVRLILATDHSRARTGAADEDLIRDIDLAILAASEDDYRAYSNAVRKEYADVSDETFAAGRSAVLSHFLAGRIFNTGSHEKLEPKARENLHRELRELGRLS
jgi:predicted metal-dependent HD superfamily phosphohydrolase